MYVCIYIAYIYIYLNLHLYVYPTFVCKHRIDMLHFQDYMDQAVSVLSVAVQGLRTHFWGLGCPSYCGSFPASSFILSFVLGWMSFLDFGFVTT